MVSFIPLLFTMDQFRTFHSLSDLYGMGLLVCVPSSLEDLAFTCLLRSLCPDDRSWPPIRSASSQRVSFYLGRSSPRQRNSPPLIPEPSKDHFGDFFGTNRDRSRQMGSFSLFLDRSLVARSFNFLTPHWREFCHHPLSPCHQLSGGTVLRTDPLLLGGETYFFSLLH
jgi:hypothetical protein